MKKIIIFALIISIIPLNIKVRFMYRDWHYNHYNDALRYFAEKRLVNDIGHKCVICKKNPITIEYSHGRKYGYTDSILYTNIICNNGINLKEKYDPNKDKSTISIKPQFKNVTSPSSYFNPLSFITFNFGDKKGDTYCSSCFERRFDFTYEEIIKMYDDKEIEIRDEYMLHNGRCVLNMWHEFNYLPHNYTQSDINLSFNPLRNDHIYKKSETYKKYLELHNEIEKEAQQKRLREQNPRAVL